MKEIVYKFSFRYINGLVRSSSVKFISFISTNSIKFNVTFRIKVYKTSRKKGKKTTSHLQKSNLTTGKYTTMIQIGCK